MRVASSRSFTASATWSTPRKGMAARTRAGDLGVPTGVAAVWPVAATSNPRMRQTPSMAYEDEKEFAGKSYRGMKVGGSHLWTYPDGKWTERKITPQRWDVAFTSLKRR